MAQGILYLRHLFIIVNYCGLPNWKNTRWAPQANVAATVHVHVRQRGDDHSRTLPYHAPARPQVVLSRLCMQPHAQGVSTPPVVQPLRRTSGQEWTFTPGNVDDREPLKDKDFTQRLFGKIFADRGYISQELFERLFIDDIHLVTKLKKNMKNSLMDLHDKILLRKRAIIETVNDELKNVCYIEHTRHRSIDGFASNLIAGLIAYNLLPKKPSLNIDIIDKSRLIA